MNFEQIETPDGLEKNSNGETKYIVYDGFRFNIMHRNRFIKRVEASFNTFYCSQKKCNVSIRESCEEPITYYINRKYNHNHQRLEDSLNTPKTNKGKKQSDFTGLLESGIDHIIPSGGPTSGLTSSHVFFRNDNRLNMFLEELVVNFGDSRSVFVSLQRVDNEGRLVEDMKNLHGVDCSGSEFVVLVNTPPHESGFVDVSIPSIGLNKQNGYFYYRDPSSEERNKGCVLTTKKYEKFSDDIAHPDAYLYDVDIFDDDMSSLPSEEGGSFDEGLVVFGASDEEKGKKDVKDLI